MVMPPAQMTNRASAATRSLAQETPSVSPRLAKRTILLTNGRSVAEWSSFATLSLDDRQLNIDPAPCAEQAGLHGAATGPLRWPRWRVSRSRCAQWSDTRTLGISLATLRGEWRRHAKPHVPNLAWAPAPCARIPLVIVSAVSQTGQKSSRFLDDTEAMQRQIRNGRASTAHFSAKVAECDFYCAPAGRGRRPAYLSVPSMPWAVRARRTMALEPPPQRLVVSVRLRVARRRAPAGSSRAAVVARPAQRVGRSRSERAVPPPSQAPAVLQPAVAALQ
jgi:hypothetical protein